MSFGAHAKLNPATVPLNVGGDDARPQQETSAPQAAHIEVETITIRPTGFEPAEITRPAGRVLLAINNSSGLDEVTLRVSREQGTQLYEAHTTRRGRNWRKLVELPPGVYILTEANHPAWVCRVTITN